MRKGESAFPALYQSHLHAIDKDMKRKTGSPLRYLIAGKEMARSIDAPIEKGAKEVSLIVRQVGGIWVYRLNKDN